VNIKTITSSRLETELQATLNECADTGVTIIVELPGQRHVSIRSLEPDEDDDLVDRLIETNPKFRELLAKAKASPTVPFVPGSLD
jgi:hypothetical protein